MESSSRDRPSSLSPNVEVNTFVADEMLAVKMKDGNAGVECSE